MIKAENITFEYIRRDEDQNVVEIKTALKNVSLHIKKGDFVAILGHNGSGKSTFAKHVNAIFTPEEGTLYVNGMDTKELDRLYDIRKSAGMVFQNPDNQIIATVVEEDVAFGPENMGVPTGKIRERVKQSLKAVNMWHRRKDSPNKLSGGQKQRVAIAGVMAMEPECIVLDEPTAMLDPKGRMDVIKTARTLNEEKNMTILLITHYMDETVGADQVIVMDHGEIVMSGTPREIFCRVDELKMIGLEVPFATRMAYELRKRGVKIRQDILTEEELAEEINRLLAEQGIHKNQLIELQPQWMKNAPDAYHHKTMQELNGESSLILDHVCYTYGKNTIYEKQVLKDVNLTFTKGEFVGIVGHTGSGKSTLIQHLNGLLTPESGAVYFCGQNISDKEFSLKFLRSKVGLSFQYPEHQLFENTVYEDVAFGPKNLGWDALKIEKNSYDAIRMVGLPDDCYDLSPFQLSGGQKRRVAIAGILAMEPDYLVLDEPTAGLDPKGRDEILDQMKLICNERGITIILVSHSMEDIAKYVDRMIVMDDGEVLYDDVPARVFSHGEDLNRIGLSVPKVTKLMKSLEKKGAPAYPYMIKEEAAADTIAGWFGNEAKQ